MAVYPLLEHLLLDSISFIYGTETDNILTVNLPTKTVKMDIESYTVGVKTISKMNEITTTSKQTTDLIKRPSDLKNYQLIQ